MTASMFRGVDQPSEAMAKHACYLCERRRPGVDTGVPIEAEGIVYICGDCIGVLATICGFETRSDVRRKLEQFRKSIEMQHDRIVELKADKERLEGHLESLKQIAEDLFPRETAGAPS